MWRRAKGRKKNTEKTRSERGTGKLKKRKLYERQGKDLIEKDFRARLAYPLGTLLQLTCMKMAIEADFF